MDFSLSEEQRALRDLAHQIFTSATSQATIERIERSEDRFDRDLWAALAETGLLGVAVPERYGGLGFATTEMAMVLEAHGRSAAPVPVLETLVVSRVLAELGSPDQQAAWLPGVADGSVVLTVALEEWGANDPAAPSVTARPSNGGWILDGTKPAVAATADAAGILVSVSTPGGPALVMVDPSAAGVSTDVSETTNNELQAIVALADVTVGDVDLIGGGATSVAWALAQHRVATAATILGCCEAAVAITVEHANNREQFGRPLGMNQAYSQRMASAAIDIDCIRATVTQAAWLIDAGLDAAAEVLVAAWWAADAGSRVVHATQHLHGGTGADISYPVHRYYLAVKQRANSLGTASSHLARLGAAIGAAGR